MSAFVQGLEVSLVSFIATLIIILFFIGVAKLVKKLFADATETLVEVTEGELSDEGMAAIAGAISFFFEMPETPFIPDIEPEGEADAWRTLAESDLPEGGE